MTRTTNATGCKSSMCSGETKCDCLKSKRTALKAVCCLYRLQFSIPSFPKWMVLFDKCVDGRRIQSGQVDRSKITASNIIPHLEITCDPPTVKQKWSLPKTGLASRYCSNFSIFTKTNHFDGISTFQTVHTVRTL